MFIIIVVSEYRSMAAAAYCRDASEDYQLEMELECVICKDIYDDPVEVSCGHNFCRKCLLQCVLESHSSYAVFWGCNCPICRKRLNLNAKKVAEMQGNLKLRNIIAAIQEKAKNKPRNCSVHKKPYGLFCEDCAEVKCFTCYMESCNKKMHTVEEIETTASRVRDELKCKKEEIHAQQQQIGSYEGTRKTMEEGLKCLSSAVCQVSALRGYFMKDVEKV